MSASGPWFDSAVRALDQGQPARAVELLKRQLAERPEDADAHALLAACLVDVRRLHAAEHEVGAALAIDPLNPVAHLARGHLLLARRNLGAARQAFEEARSIQPGDEGALLGLARVAELQGRRAEVEPLLRQALDLDPDSIEARTALGHFLLQRGDRIGAEGLAREALTISAESVDALVLLGWIRLRTGQSEDARELARSALASDPADREAIRLLAAAKAHRSFWLGLWWRWSAWMGEFGDGRSILILLGAFALYRLSLIALVQADQGVAASAAQITWLAVCAYTWIGPVIFRRALDRELATIRLRTDF